MVKTSKDARRMLHVLYYFSPSLNAQSYESITLKKDKTSFRQLRLFELVPPHRSHSRSHLLWGDILAAFHSAHGSVGRPCPLSVLVFQRMTETYV